LAEADFVSEFVDTKAGDLPLRDKLLLTTTPIPWNDVAGLDFIDFFFTSTGFVCE
jgi:hypothetical protein